MKVVYYAPFGLPTGYARAAADYAVALARAGVQVQIRPLYDDYQSEFLPPALERELLALTAEFSGEPDVILVHETPAASTSVELLRKVDDGPRGRRKCLLTTWETDRGPASVTEMGRLYDAIAVPSDCAAEAFHEALLDVAILPHTFDPEFWRPLPFDNATDEYLFYFIGTWDNRKNPLGVLTAYLAEFYGRNDQVALHIQTNDTFDAAALDRHIQHAMGLRNYLLPRFTIDARPIASAGLDLLHMTGNCFVTAARGEAWCLPAFEAACKGRPVIAPSFGGMNDYLGDLSGWYPQVDVQMTPVVASVLPKLVAGQPAMVRVGPEGADATQCWGEPDLYELRSLMRFAYDERVGKSGEPPHTSHDAALNFDTLRLRYGYATVGKQLAAWLANEEVDGNPAP
jgi:hypothetical protein